MCIPPVCQCQLQALSTTVHTDSAQSSIQLKLLDREVIRRVAVADNCMNACIVCVCDLVCNS
jgi:hypothetical protein